jgi:hypothetical protein
MPDIRRGASYTVYGEDVTYCAEYLI